MATIAHVIALGVLHEHRVEAHDGRISRRSLYVADCFYDWVDETDELRKMGWGRNAGGRTRQEHLMQILNDFLCDERPLVGGMNRIIPTSKGVWKLQPNGVRVFGWVPAQHAFVAVCGALEEDTHGPNSVVKDRCDKVIKFARDHGLYGTILRGDRRALFPSST